MVFRGFLDEGITFTSSAARRGGKGGGGVCFQGHPFPTPSAATIPVPCVCVCKTLHSFQPGPNVHWKNIREGTPSGTLPDLVLVLPTAELHHCHAQEVTISALLPLRSSNQERPKVRQRYPYVLQSV